MISRLLYRTGGPREDNRRHAPNQILGLRVTPLKPLSADQECPKFLLPLPATT